MFQQPLNLGLTLLSRKCWYVKPPGARIWNRACIIRGSPYYIPPPLSTLPQFSFWVHSYFGFYYLDDAEDMSTNESISPHSSLELWLQFLEHENSINQDSHVCVEMFEVSFGIFAYYEFVMWNGTQRIQDCQQEWPDFPRWKTSR